MRSGKLPASLCIGCSVEPIVAVPTYLTYAWPGDKSQLKVEEQIAQAIRVKNAGFNHQISVHASARRGRCPGRAEVKAAVGPDFRVMVDRTAHLSGALWDYPTGLAGAKALQTHSDSPNHSNSLAVYGFLKNRYGLERVIDEAKLQYSNLCSAIASEVDERLVETVKQEIALLEPMHKNERLRLENALEYLVKAQAASKQLD